MADDNHLMSSLLRRKAEPELISRKATSSSSASLAGSGGASPHSPAIAAFASRSSAVQQIHRSLKAWRDEDKEPAAKPAEADKASDEKVDDGAKDAKSAGGGGEQTNANKNLAQDDGGKQEGAEGTEAKADSAGSAPGAEAAPAAAPEGAASEGEEVKEEAPAVGTKLKVLAKAKTPEEKKKKEEEIAKKRELCKQKVALAAAQAEQYQKIGDFVAGFGLDALMALAGTVAGPAGAALVNAIKAAVGYAQDGVNIALDAKREVQADVLTKAIETMSSRQIKLLTNKWTNVEPTLAAMEGTIQPHVDLIRNAGVAGGAVDHAQSAGKGAAQEAGKKVATGFLEKWVPFVGTALKIVELIQSVNAVAAAREEIEKLEEELK